MYILYFCIFTSEGCSNVLYPQRRRVPKRKNRKRRSKKKNLKKILRLTVPASTFEHVMGSREIRERTVRRARVVKIGQMEVLMWRSEN